MRKVFILVRKEVRQVVRSKAMVALIFALPTLQLLVLPLAATFEMKEIRLHVVDMDHSSVSRALVATFAHSPFYSVAGASHSHREAEEALMVGKADATLEIPAHFERDLHTRGAASLQLVINAINGTAAGLISAYSTSIIRDFPASGGTLTLNTVVAPTPPLTYSCWFNPQLSYKTYMVPGILVMLVSIIGLFLTSMNMVREKEIGTIEQINVTPIRRWEFILGKSIPFVGVGLLDLTIGLLLARFVYHVPTLGSVALVYLVILVYLLPVLGLGLFFSAISNTQQQAMFIAWFFVMIFVLMSGLFTPIESMPPWAQTANLFNPLSYGVKVVRMVMLKGSGFADIWRELCALLAYGLAAMSLAVAAYRKTG
ncbi:MAG: ABC transporter permease [Prevotellaceae bacterium]|jgi:ABC-2 type transport system permease protein|nr:ABC transporter permease [Prevotellaceae bacterium]